MSQLEGNNICFSGPNFFGAFETHAIHDPDSQGKSLLNIHNAALSFFERDLCVVWLLEASGKLPRNEHRKGEQTLNEGWSVDKAHGRVSRQELVNNQLKMAEETANESGSATHLYLFGLLTLFNYLKDNLPDGKKQHLRAVFERSPFPPGSKPNWVPVGNIAREAYLAKGLARHFIRDLRVANQIKTINDQQPKTAFIVTRGPAHLGLLYVLDRLTNKQLPLVNIPDTITITNTGVAPMLALNWDPKFVNNLFEVLKIDPAMLNNDEYLRSLYDRIIPRLLTPKWRGFFSDMEADLSGYSGKRIVLTANLDWPPLC